VLGAVSMVIVRTLKDVDVTVITAWNGFVTIFPSLVVSLAMGTFHVPDLGHCGLIVLIGVLTYLGQYIITLALQVCTGISILL
jgi:drug/metabolite transporter (DMT)-like permease